MKKRPFDRREVRARLLAMVLVHKLRRTSFTILADDCWGGTFYQALRIPYQTPLVGTQIMTPCFLQLVSDPKRILRAPLQFKQESRYPRITAEREHNSQNYPIAELAGEVEILFMHYANSAQASAAWERRLARVDWNNLFFKMDAVRLGATMHRAECGIAADFFRLCPQRSVLIAESRRDLSFDRVVCLGNRYTVNGHDAFYLALSRFDPCVWINQDVVRSSLSIKAAAAGLAPRFRPISFDQQPTAFPRQKFDTELEEQLT